MRLKLIVFFILLVLVGMALSQAALETKTIGNKTVGNNTSGRQPSSAELFAVVLLLVVFAGIPLILNTYLAHKHISEMHTSLDQFIKIRGEKFDEAKLVQIIHDCINSDPSGAPGTARSAMALTITLIVGTALFFLVVYPPTEPTNSTIKDIILTLTGALTAIIGFYFGGKGTEAAQPTNVQPTNTQTADTKPAIAKPEAGWYKIKIDFPDGNDRYIAGHIENLSNVPADKLADWITKKYIEPYTEPS